MKALLCKLFGWYCAVTPPPVVEAPKPNPVPDVVVISDPSDMKKEIEDIVMKSKCKDFYFNDYGNSKAKAPLGYVKGMALSYPHAKCVSKFNMDLPVVFAETLSLGLWECSGACCGADLSSKRPNKITEDSAEGGQWQSSWDLKYKIPSIVSFTKNWQGDCNLESFGRCTGKEAKTWGDIRSDGARFQEKLKSCPSFGLEVVLMNWAERYKHYGPFKTGKVQRVQACVDMFRAIDEVVACK